MIHRLGALLSREKKKVKCDFLQMWESNHVHHQWISWNGLNFGLMAMRIISVGSKIGDIFTQTKYPNIDIIYYILYKAAGVDYA